MRPRRALNDAHSVIIDEIHRHQSRSTMVSSYSNQLLQSEDRTRHRSVIMPRVSYSLHQNNNPFCS